MLFFSGGTALKKLSIFLKEKVFSVHLLTAFDSGGSSAEIRKHFQVFALGDLRNRLLSLMDISSEAQRNKHKFLSYRLPQTRSPEALREEFKTIVQGEHPLVLTLSREDREVILFYLQYLYPRLPQNFSLAKASIGNLFLLGLYLHKQKDLNSFLEFSHTFLQIKGLVRPIVDASLDLLVYLEGGEKILGQHKITGKECPPLKKKIKNIYLYDKQKKEIVRPAIAREVRQYILKSKLILYPMGSFFSSILCSLLVQGVGRTIGQSKARKIFIPNLGEDPELYGYSLLEQVEKLVEVLEVENWWQGVEIVLLDKKHHFLTAQEKKFLESRGIEIVFRNLVSPESFPYYDASLLGNTLLGFLS